MNRFIDNLLIMLIVKIVLFLMIVMSLLALKRTVDEHGPIAVLLNKFSIFEKLQ